MCRLFIHILVYIHMLFNCCFFGCNWLHYTVIMNQVSLLEKEKFEREISDGKIEIPHKFLGRKI